MFEILKNWSKTHFRLVKREKFRYMSSDCVVKPISVRLVTYHQVKDKSEQGFSQRPAFRPFARFYW